MGATLRQRTLRRRTLQRALELAGSRRSLARGLRVPLGELEDWLAGRDTPPTAIFLAAVDIVSQALEPAPAIEAAPLHLR